MLYRPIVCGELLEKGFTGRVRGSLRDAPNTDISWRGSKGGWVSRLPPGGGGVSNPHFLVRLVRKWPEVRRQRTGQFCRNVLAIHQDPQQLENALATPELTSCCSTIRGRCAAQSWREELRSKREKEGL